VEVAGVGKLREGEELGPGEGDGIFDEAGDFEFPFVERDFRADAEVEDGKLWTRRWPGGRRLVERTADFSLPAILRAQRSLAAMYCSFIRGTKMAFSGEKAMV